ncbi:MAG TPA: cobyrinate a,c-diamide synthase [Mycobacteriales bacterium]|nr:cobyrinate a,c-diamide synthase [Mycobacteriales bacterium]
MVSLPRLVVAAASSGAGKTTVATGLMAALTARGLRVSGHKVGPDYIDPSHHAVATGRPGRNLDPFLVGEALIGPLFLHGARGADIAVVEGVMGLFDGRGATDEASTAHLARLLDAPVVMVVDASAQSRSVAALVHGFTTFDLRVRIAGVILNRVASPRHEQLLREALAGSGVPVLGALHRDPALSTPSRHLGLVPAPERMRETQATVHRLAAAVAAAVDLEAVLTVARLAPPLAATPWSPHDAVGKPTVGRPVVAVAGGAAFTFSYTETSELLTAAGADVVTVDPLRDEALPERTRALVLGGGFPEVHAADLTANAGLRAAVAALAASGGRVHAECAGLLYLTRELDGHPMCGVLSARARMTDRLTIGYREVTGPDGVVVRGHEFHRTACDPPAGPRPAWRLADGRAEGFRDSGVVASYLHVHPAGSPRLAAALVGAA